MKSPWQIKKLGEISIIKTGKKDVDEGNPKGEYPFFTCAKEITYSDTYSFDTEAILIAGNGDVGATKIYKGKFEAYQRTYVLDSFYRETHIKYIYYYLIGNLKKITIKNKAGSTMPYIRKGDLENLPIPLPPLPIQQKIVFILDTIEKAIEIQEKIIEKTKELKKSTMNILFKYGAPSFWENSNPDQPKRKLKKTEIGEMPKEWETTHLGEKKIFEIKLGGTPSTSIKEYWNGDIPWITPNDLKDLNYQNYILDTGRKISKKGLQNGSNLLNENSIILSTRAPIGYIAILKNPMAFNQGCKGIVILDKNRIDVKFLYYFLLLKKKYLIELGTGSTFRELSTNDLKEIYLPLPSLSEQQEIVEILQTIDKKIELEEKKKALYEELFSAMLDKLMKGEIDVENINFE